MLPSQVLGRLQRELKLCGRKAESMVLDELIKLSRGLIKKNIELKKENFRLKRQLRKADAKPTTSE